MGAAFALAALIGCSSGSKADDIVTLVIGGRNEGEIEPCG